MDHNRKNSMIVGAVATLALLGAYAYYSSREEVEGDAKYE